MMGLYYGDAFGWGFNSLFMAIIMFIFWIAVIFLVVWIFREMPRRESEGCKSDSAVEILKERYAKGEIDKKEYEERKKILEKG